MLFSVIFIACNFDEELSKYKTNAKESLDVFVASKNVDDYNEENWLAIIDIGVKGRKAINSAKSKTRIDTVKYGTMNEIDAIYSKEDDMKDFILTISIDQIIVTQGDKITAIATLNNHSGKTQNITILYGLISWQYMEGWNYYTEKTVHNIPWNEVFLEGDIMTSSEVIWVEMEQAIGTYTLQAIAMFFLNYGQENEEKIIVKSNILNILVQ